MADPEFTTTEAAFITGLPIRDVQKAFDRIIPDERFHVAVEQAQRHHQPLSLALLDVDHFKRINDEHGHEAGDLVLREVARRLGQAVRTGDFLARYGGDEFVMVLDTQRTIGDPVALVQRTRREVEGPVLLADGRTHWDIKASIGIALSEPGDALDDVIERADASMYRDKRSRSAHSH